MAKRCVITGVGIICAAGNSADECWTSIKNGKSGIDVVKSVSTEGCYSHLGAEVKCEKLPAEGYDRSVRLCVKAAEEAIADSALTGDYLKSAGTILGSCVGGAASIDKYYTDEMNGKADSADIPRMEASAIAAGVSKYLGLDGVTANIVNACAAGTMSISYACDLIKDGTGDVYLSGGTDAFSSLAFAGFHALHALAENACSPLNKSNGITLGEGAAVLVVEEYEHAAARGAKIYCEVSGYGVSSDAHHITAPHPQGEGQMSAITKAMQSAGVEPSEIAYINAHGTGTAKNDEAEFLSLHTLFDGTNLSVSSTKSMTGHCLGAAGAIEAAITVKAMSENIAPPTIGYDEDDLARLKEKAGDLDFIANKAEEKNLETVMSNSFAFGGTNASIIFSKKEHKAKEGRKEPVYITGLGAVMSADNGENSRSVTLDSGAFAARDVKLGFYRKLDRFSQMQLLSGIDALKDAGITVDADNEKLIGGIVGTANGPMAEITSFQKTVCEKGPTAGSAFSFPNTVYNAAGGHLSIFTKTKGYCATVANGSQAGIQSIAYAYDVLQKGDEQVMMACGTDENSAEIDKLFRAAGAGESYVLGEGSSALVLETKSFADGRSVHKYAEVAGCALTHSAECSAEALDRAIENALAKAGASAAEIKAVYGFANGTSLDEMQKNAVSRYFAGATVVDVRAETGDCRAASDNYAALMAAKAIDGGEYENAIVLGADRSGSFSAAVLKRV